MNAMVEKNTKRAAFQFSFITYEHSCFRYELKFCHAQSIDRQRISSDSDRYSMDVNTIWSFQSKTIAWLIVLKFKSKESAFIGPPIQISNSNARSNRYVDKSTLRVAVFYMNIFCIYLFARFFYVRSNVCNAVSRMFYVHMVVCIFLNE